MVPTFGTMYAQLVSSPVAADWNELRPVVTSSGVLLRPPPTAEDSSRSLALHDVQLSQFRTEWFTPLTEPVPVFQ